MAKLIIYPDERLSRISTEFNSMQLTAGKVIAKEMIRIMRIHNGLGLSAPQIGINKRLIVWKDQDDNEYTGINPEIKSSLGKFKSKEGCLSAPNIERIIKRKRVIVVSAINIDGNPVEWHLKNKEAAIVQHEIDHLDGITILSKRKK